MTADLAIKEPVRAATTGNITLSGLQTIDGVALSSGDRVLVRAQTSTTQNGIYVAASGGWTRATDFDGAGEATGGSQVYVQQGTMLGDIAWRVAGDGAVTPGSSAVAFEPEFLQLGTGAVARSLGDKALELISVRDFGAAGDGTTDDTAAINLAADAAQAAGGALIFPAGTYGIDGYIQIDDGVRAVLGLGGTIKFLPGASSNTGLNLRPGVEGCRVEGLIIDMNGEAGNAIFAQNVVNCSIARNRIVGASQASYGILVRSYIGGDPAVGNLVIDNHVDGTGNAADGSAGIAVDVEFPNSPNAPTYWKANHAARPISVANRDAIVSGNNVEGFYFGFAGDGLADSLISNNRFSGNVRNIILANGALNNQIRGNLCRDSESSAIHLAYGASGNLIEGNRIANAVNEVGVSNGSEALLQAYLGCQDNVFRDNATDATSEDGPLFHVYVGPHCDGTLFEDNVLRGSVARAYMAMESAWDARTAEVHSYAYARGAASDAYDGFASLPLANVTFSGNTIAGDAEAAAIALLQISDEEHGGIALDSPVVERNRVIGNGHSYQLYLLEQDNGALATGRLRDNSFDGAAAIADFVLPRGRAHFRTWGGNAVIDEARVEIANGDTTPSVAIGRVFTCVNSGSTSITDFDDGVDEQEITVRLDVWTTLVHGSGTMRLKGGVNATGNADNLVHLRQMSGVWFESGRNF